MPPLNDSPTIPIGLWPFSPLLLTREEFRLLKWHEVITALPYLVAIPGLMSVVYLPLVYLGWRIRCGSANAAISARKCDVQTIPAARSSAPRTRKQCCPIRGATSGRGMPYSAGERLPPTSMNTDDRGRARCWRVALSGFAQVHRPGCEINSLRDPVVERMTAVENICDTSEYPDGLNESDSAARLRPLRESS